MHAATSAKIKAADFRSELGPLLHLAAPLILAELGWMAMSVLDTVMVGRLPNSAVAMAASALAQVLFNTLAFGVGGVLLGLDTLVSQAFGAKETDEANHWFLHGLVLAVLLSGLLVLAFLAGPYLLNKMPVDRAVLAGAIPALGGLTWGTLPLLLYFTLRRYLQAAHHGRSIAVALVSANAVNAFLDWLLIFGHSFHFGSHTLAITAYGVVGSSWATSFARLYLVLFLAAAAARADHKHRYGLRRAFGRITSTIQLQHLRRLFLLGAPAGAQIFVEIAIFALVTSLIATLGPLPLAGHEVALQCASTSFMVPFAISSATAVRVGHALGRVRAGAGTVAQAAAAGWSGIAAGATAMLIASAVFVTIPAQVARIFTPDRNVIAAAVPLLLVAAGFQFFDGLQITATGALRGAGNTTAPLYTQLVCFWAIGMPLGVLLGFHFKLGAAGLWWGLLIALTGASIVLIYVWNRTTKTLAPTRA